MGLIYTSVFIFTIFDIWTSNFNVQDLHLLNSSRFTQFLTIKKNSILSMTPSLFSSNRSNVSISSSSVNYTSCPSTCETISFINFLASYSSRAPSFDTSYLSHTVFIYSLISGLISTSLNACSASSYD